MSLSSPCEWTKIFKCNKREQQIARNMIRQLESRVSWQFSLIVALIFFQLMLASPTVQIDSIRIVGNSNVIKLSRLSRVVAWLIPLYSNVAVGNEAYPEGGRVCVAFPESLYYRRSIGTARIERIQFQNCMRWSNCLDSFSAKFWCNL